MSLNKSCWIATLPCTLHWGISVSDEEICHLLFYLSLFLSAHHGLCCQRSLLYLPRWTILHRWNYFVDFSVLCGSFCLVWSRAMSTQSVPHIWLQAPFLLPLEPICLQKTVFLTDASSHSFSECKFSLQDWDYKSHPLYSLWVCLSCQCSFHPLFCHQCRVSCFPALHTYVGRRQRTSVHWIEYGRAFRIYTQARCCVQLKCLILALDFSYVSHVFRCSY